MDRRWLQIEDICILPRHRNADAEKVKEIARSIKEIGLLNPPAVRFVEGINPDGEPDEEWCGVAVLIAGRHRLLALTELGETAVECVVHEVSDLRAELMEIDENLARAELPPAAEMEHLLRRDELWVEIAAEEAEKESGDLIATLPKTGRGNKQFAAQIAAITGEHKSTINKKLALGRKLRPALKRIAGTSLDAQVEMSALAEMLEPARLALIERAVAGEKVSARRERPPKQRDPQDANHDMQELVDEAITVLGADKMPFVICLLEGSPKKLAVAIRARLRAH